MIINCLVMAACEICFTLYSRPHDLVNMTGHLLLLGGVALQYFAVLRVGLLEPRGWSTTSST